MAYTSLHMKANAATASRRLFLLCVIAAAGIALAACARNEAQAGPAGALAEPLRVEFALNTVCTVMLYDQARPEVYDAIFSRIREIERLMSVFLPDSDISRINAAAGIEPVQVHEDVFKVIERAVHIAELSGGAFDPTVGPLTFLWGITGGSPRVPSQEEIDAVLPLVNWRYIELDPQERTVFLKQPGMALDLGAIAKGYAADEALAIIQEARLERALIDLGGNVITFGTRPDGALWRAGLQTPLGRQGEILGVISGSNMTIVTSGVSQRYFMYDGVRYHHLFSPFEGHPARTGLLAATIVTQVSMDADALSTAIFVLGYEKGRALIEPLEGVEAIFLFEDRSIRKTPGIDFELHNENFRLLTD